MLYRKRNNGLFVVGVAALVLLARVAAHATDYTGTVTFTGVLGVLPPGILATDMIVEVKDTAESMGGGTKCIVNSVTPDVPDPDGTFPGTTGSVSLNITMMRGGSNDPDPCLITIRALGDDGASVSALGFVTHALTFTEVNAMVNINVGMVTVQQSKAIAGTDVTADCLKWVKLQTKKRAKCNVLLLKKGGAEGSLKCKDAGFPEPANCDPGSFVETILAFAHDGNDQQIDPPNALGVDATALKDQINCQKKLGKAAANYVAKRNKFVMKNCVQALADSAACRAKASKDSNRKLSTIDTCVPEILTDIGSGLAVPDFKSPCHSLCVSGGALDQKCVKSCFQEVLDQYSDGIIGNLPVCGNNILQPGEGCDDGNTTAGDGCSATCTVE